MYTHYAVDMSVVLLMYIYWYIIKTNGVKYTLFFISRPYMNTRNPYHI